MTTTVYIPTQTRASLWLGWLVCSVVGCGLSAAEVSLERSSALAEKSRQSVEQRHLWSFQPMTSPQPPKTTQPSWIQSPIDTFILNRLQEKGLKPVGPARRRTLIRRATFDLIGLPPSPDEVEAFLADRSPQAFARVVDRLLASSHYGERWGRHWLDVVRYADSNGLDENVAFGNAWRYRDYVIRAFNQDKPYDTFVQEQLAGDLLPRGADATLRREQLTALGFLCIGPKLLAEPDKVKLEMDMIDEQIETLGRAFLGTTLGCARCHDHKFDPISTEDYYAMATIFKSTQTMDDLKTIAKWHEIDVTSPEDTRTQEAWNQRIASQKLTLTNTWSEAYRQLNLSLGTNSAPKDPETTYPSNTLASLQHLRDEIKKVEDDAPEPATSMGVTEATNILHSLPVHIRGSHLSLGKAVARGVPKAMASFRSVAFEERQSGRLDLARWITDPEHPLTARVMVNRVWRWHFGQGLVPSTDNFGKLGQEPSHPELLDWLARRFIAEGWSLKSMHRLMMLSSTYQMSCNAAVGVDAIDPENRLLSHFSVRRLEAEEIRDAVMSVSGELDATAGGKTIPLKNREFVFNHTSKDNTRYDAPRRAVYLPVIRNHLYDLFEQFDFPDPAVPNGNRSATVVAPQALLMMNSDWVSQAARQFAEHLLASFGVSNEARLNAAYIKVYGRPATSAERRRAGQFLMAFPGISGAKPFASLEAWTAFCQTLMAANEFIYLN